MAAGFLDYIPPECLEPPPAIYDYVPETIPPITYLPRETMRLIADMLTDLPPKYIMCGATIRAGGKIEIFIMEGMPVDATEAVKRHELGHVNGWKHRSAFTPSP